MSKNPSIRPSVESLLLSRTAAALASPFKPETPFHVIEKDQTTHYESHGGLTKLTTDDLKASRLELASLDANLGAHAKQAKNTEERKATLMRQQAVRSQFVFITDVHDLARGHITQDEFRARRQQARAYEALANGHIAEVGKIPANPVLQSKPHLLPVLTKTATVPTPPKAQPLGLMGMAKSAMASMGQGLSQLKAAFASRSAKPAKPAPTVIAPSTAELLKSIFFGQPTPKLVVAPKRQPNRDHLFNPTTVSEEFKAASAAHVSRFQAARASRPGAFDSRPAALS